MGRRRRRLRPGWRLLCRQLCSGRRGLASGSRRSSYSRLSSAAHEDLAGAALSARSNGQKCRSHLRIWGRLRLFQAGFIAGGIQAGIVLVMTPLVILFAQYRDDDPDTSSRDPTLSLISLLPLIYVVLAAGVALTRHRYITLTSTRIRHASRLMSSSEPDRTAGTLAICFLFASIGCASFALQPLRHSGFDGLASRPPRGWAHIVVGIIERLRGQFRSKRTCRHRRHALIWNRRLLGTEFHD